MLPQLCFAAFTALWTISPILASAIPDLTTAETGAACNPSRRKRVTFDKLALGSSPPTGLGSTIWTGFTVTNPSNTGGFGVTNGINPSSPPNYAQLEFPVGSSISGYYNASNPVGWNGIASFDFACATIVGNRVPGPCSLSVVATTGDSRSTVLGTYDFPGGSPGVANMTTVTLQVLDVFALQSYYFVVVDGPRYGQLFVDNVVIATTVNC